MGLVEETLNILVGRKMPPGYDRKLHPTPEGIYWHLYWGAERVNGGLADDDKYARVESCRAAWCHHHSMTEASRRPLTDLWDAQEYAALLRYGSEREGWWTARDVKLD